MNTQKSPALHQRLEHPRTRRLCQRRELDEGVLSILGGAFGPHPDQHYAFEAKLPVLDLADVGQLGRQADDPAQRNAVLEVETACRLVDRIQLGEVVDPTQADLVGWNGLIVSPAGRDRHVAAFNEE